ncbi:hypothetical protein ACF1BB_26710 [Streptomyces griseoluteus]|uniref:hypothetical protein n=1 Tax=Streptomyces griseoluteus TaxID=29306 RepID=UPI0036F58AD9
MTPIVPITCGLCTDSYRATPTDGEFVYACGEQLTAADIELDTGQVRGVDASGALVPTEDRAARIVADAAAYGRLLTPDDVARCGADIARMGVHASMDTQVR